MTVSQFDLRMYKAYERWRIPFEAQVPWRGGTLLRGGFVIDAVVYNPFKVPVEHFGTYWHTGTMANEDRLKLAILAQDFQREPIVIWEYEAETQEDANAVAYRKVYRG